MSQCTLSLNWCCCLLRPGTFQTQCCQCSSLVFTYFPPHTVDSFSVVGRSIDMILHLQYLLVKSSAKICHLWQNGFDLCILVSVCRDYSTKPHRHDRGKVCCHVYEHVYVCKVGVTVGHVCRADHDIRGKVEWSVFYHCLYMYSYPMLKEWGMQIHLSEYWYSNSS